MERAYSCISEFYDYILRHVDYEHWYRYIRSVMFRYIDNPRTILEIGCGTGKFGAKFSRDDFTIFGMDISLDMLLVAKSRAFRNFSVFCADVRNFALCKKIDFIFAVHDTMNYMIDADEMRKAFVAIAKIMHPLSIFMFDLTTEHNIKNFFDGKVSTYVRGNSELTWQNSYDPVSRIVTSILSVKKNGVIRQEAHRQKIYTTEEIIPILNDAELEVVDIFGDYSFDSPDENTVMINYIVKRKT